ELVLRSRPTEPGTIDRSVFERAIQFRRGVICSVAARAALVRFSPDSCRAGATGNRGDGDQRVSLQGQLLRGKGPIIFHGETAASTLRLQREARPARGRFPMRINRRDTLRMSSSSLALTMGIGEIVAGLVPKVSMAAPASALSSYDAVGLAELIRTKQIA